MNRLQLLISILVLMLMACGLSAQAPFRMVDDVECVVMDKTQLVFPGSDSGYARVRLKLDSLLSGRGGDFNIWHVGGSHVQAGHFSGTLRNNLAFIFPTASRGVIFPFSIAGTNWNRSYSFSASGEWEICRNTSKEPGFDLGMTGISARTCDPSASLGLDMTVDTLRVWEFNTLTILGYGSSVNVCPVVESRGVEYSPITVDTLSRSYVFRLPSKVDSALIKFPLGEGEWFVFQGIIPSDGSHGISYYESGINGASLPCWLRCRDLGRNLSLIRPDLAILAVGVNDSSVPAANFNPEDFKARYRALIALLHESSPECSLIFITNNDCYRYAGRRRRMVHNDNGDAVQKAMTELAAEYSCPVWDLYALMGGNGSVQAWTDAALVGRDKLHFTRSGYQLLADLLYNAILNDYMSQL